MKYHSSSKKMVQKLVEQCRNFGVNHVVISPGSRNAPLIIAFDNHPDFICYSIPDERSAAFYALGMAKQLNEAVALVCTSGTAVMNYAAALTEAYYQEIPLIAITADRPPELIDQEDGQTIRQENVFANHIRYSCSLPTKEDQLNLDIGKSKIHQALQATVAYPNGPVHINIPFNEPLYDFEEIEINELIKPVVTGSEKISLDQTEEFIQTWNKSEKIMLLIGVSTPSEELNDLISKFAEQKNIVVFAPATSNIQGKNTFNVVESLFFSALVKDETTLKPDMLITMGGPVVSKAAKQFLRKNKPAFHFDIDVNPAKIDTYNALSDKFTCDPIDFLNIIFEKTSKKQTGYLKLWNQKNILVAQATEGFLNDFEWSDLAVFLNFFNTIPFEINLHLANSTPVRYAELFNKHPKVNYYCNRGTSGIDGSTSTAAGAAVVSQKTTLLITGDISFFYDSNAFWNNHVPNNLKVILINNGGGNIFKVIRGPETTKQLDSLFVTKQNAKTEKLCEAFDIKYYSCNSEKQLSKALNLLYNSEKCTVLEIFTPSDKSAVIYRELFTAYKS